MESQLFSNVQNNLAALLESPGLRSVYVETLTGKIAYMIEPVLNEGGMIEYIGGAIMLSDVRRFYGAQEITED